MLLNPLKPASPIRSVSIIDNRLNLVETFFLNQILLRDITTLLERSQDSQRILQKLSLGRGNADDLVGLAHTIETTQQVLERLQADKHYHQDTIETLLAEVNVPLALAKSITKAIDEEGLMQQQRLEETEATISAALATQAQEAIMDIGDNDEAPAVEAPRSKKKVRSVGPVIGKRMVSESQMEKLEAWVMQKRFGINYYSHFFASTPCSGSRRENTMEINNIFSFLNSLFSSFSYLRILETLAY